MKITLAFLLLLLTGCASTSLAQNDNRYNAIHSGIAWFDQHNKEVNAHGSCIVKEGDTYFLFGEYKSDTLNAFTGFSCYSSNDLMNWKFERIVLPRQADGLLGPNRIGERVKVMKCESTGEYVMYMHADDLGYRDPHVGYATSKTIDGEYEFQGALLFDGKPIRRWDLGSYQDDDGTGYLLAHEGNIYKLASDYKSVEQIVLTGAAPGGESPAMFKHRGIYYWMFSNKTSWERNDNYYLTATAIEGPWNKRGLIAPEGSLTWNSQCSFILPVYGKNDTTYIYTGDRWSFPKQGSAGTYVWQPIVLEGDAMSLPAFQSSWSIDPKTAQWQSVEIKSKVLRKPGTTKGGWEKWGEMLVSKVKGAALTYSFKGRQIGIRGLTNSTGGYAHLILTNSKKEEIINTYVDFSSKAEVSSLRFMSPLLESDSYTLTIEVVGIHPMWTDKAKNIFGSSDDYVCIEEVFVL